VAGRAPCEDCPPPSSLPPSGLEFGSGPSFGPRRERRAGPAHHPHAGEESVPRLHAVSDESYPDWDGVYLDNVRRLYQLMYSRVGNRPDAEDLTSEVFTAALGPLRTNRSKPEVRAYLIATARTVLAGYWRRTLGIEVTTIDVDAAVAFMDDPLSPPSDPDDRPERVLARLPERYRRILELRFLQSMSIKEAAAEMRITVGNAKVLQHRALQRAAEVGKDLVS
jgi:RNA polymerase sigma factor (sigma-70 family)